MRTPNRILGLIVALAMAWPLAAQELVVPPSGSGGLSESTADGLYVRQDGTSGPPDMTGAMSIIPDVSGTPLTVTSVSNDTADAMTVIGGAARAAFFGRATAASSPLVSLVIPNTDTGDFLYAVNNVTNVFRLTSAGNILLPAGTAGAPSMAWRDDPDTGLVRQGVNSIGIIANATYRAVIGPTVFSLASGTLFGFASGDPNTTSQDVILARDAAGVLGLRNATTAQEFRVYETYTSSTNYETLRFFHSGGSSYIQTDKGSGGGSASGLFIGSVNDAVFGIHINGGVRWRFRTSSDAYALMPEATNSYDLGGTSLTVRSGYFGTSLISPILDSGAATNLLLKYNGTTMLDVSNQVLIGNGSVTMRGVGRDVFDTATAPTVDGPTMGRVYSNTGATARNDYTLPTAVGGRHYQWVILDADGIRITANTADTIRVIDKVTAAAGYIESTTIGSVVTLVAINATEWVATSIHGVWTDGTFTYDDTSLTTP